MAYGDVGGAVTELVITCVTRRQGEVDIDKGDALILAGEAYEVDNAGQYSDRIFGQALASCVENNQAIPVKVRGICILRYHHAELRPEVRWKVMMSGRKGFVCAADYRSPGGGGIVLQVDTSAEEVHVLL